MQNLFDFASYESIIKERYEVIKYYHPNNNLNKAREEENKELEKLKKKIYQTVEAKIARFENDYMRVHNKKYNDFFENKFLYKQIKKSLFKWRGYWSDKKLFYLETDKLKLKIKNHYTSYYAKPILTTILDIEYYLPKFTKFDSTKIFKNSIDRIKYKIRLNVDEILCDSKKDITKLASDRCLNLLYDIYKFSNKKMILTKIARHLYFLTYPEPHNNMIIRHKTSNPQ